MHQSLSIGVDLDVEDADGFVFQGEVVVRFSGNFDFGGSGLGDQYRCKQRKEDQLAFHAANCSTGVTLWLAGEADPFFHLVEILGESAAARGG